MTQAQLIDALAVILQVEPSTIQPTSELRSFRLWDSTAGINLLVVFDEHEIAVAEDTIRVCERVQDLLDLVCGDKTRAQKERAEPLQEDCL